MSSLALRAIGRSVGLRVAAMPSIGVRIAPAARLFSTTARSRGIAVVAPLPVPSAIAAAPSLLRSAGALQRRAAAAPVLRVRMGLPPVRWSSTAFKQPPTYSPHPPPLKATPDSSTYPMPNAEPKPFESVFGVENVSASSAAAADAKAASSAAAASGEAAAGEIKTTLASGASTAHSPSAAFQAGAEENAGGGAPKKGVRQLLKQYGAVFVGFYGVLYVGTLAGLYALISSGAIGGQDAVDLLEKTGAAKLLGIDVDELNPKHGNFAVAWVATKFTEPIRLALALALTPRVDLIVRRSFPAVAKYLPKQIAKVTAKTK